MFTCVMVSLTAVLDQFAGTNLAREIALGVLRALLKLHPNGDEVLRSQFANRLNGWRSTATLRGFYDQVHSCRFELIQASCIQNGHIPPAESNTVEAFLVWLLGGNEACFHTMSSDVAGIAFCLRDLGFDIIDVQGEGFGDGLHDSPCKVLYSPSEDMHRLYDSGASTAHTGIAHQLSRPVSTIVPVRHPEESIAIFPISMDAQNNCRSAWKCGQEAAKAIKIGVKKPDISDTSPTTQRQGVHYGLVNGGSEPQRTTAEFNTLASSFGLLKNQDLLAGLQRCMGSMSPSLHAWLISCTDSGMNNTSTTAPNIHHPEMTDQTKIDAFCVFQSFFMGYYYHIFGRLVDTSTLTCQTVEGAWGFRSPHLLRGMQTILSNIYPQSMSTTHSKVLGRARVLEILAMLFMGMPDADPRDGFQPPNCMGIVGPRTLLINSLVGKCASPREIGRFTLLDVDVGGLPRDHQGFVIAGQMLASHGAQPLAEADLLERAQENLREKNGVAEDVNFGIEADWEGNPDAALVCVRYKGRRITTISPCELDRVFCHSFMPSETESVTASHRPCLDKAVEVDLAMIMEAGAVLPLSPSPDIPVLFQALDRPKLRYTAASLYGFHHCLQRVVTDSVRSAKQDPRVSELDKASQPWVLIAGMTNNVGNIPVKGSDIEIYEIPAPDTGV